jgi:hypothetical protein
MLSAMWAPGASETITAAELEPMSMQASVFTPEPPPNGWTALRDLGPRWAHVFDAEPVVLDGDRGVARVTLRSASGEWRLDVEAGRADVYWMRARPSTPPTPPAEFQERAVAVLDEYVALVGVRVGRLAAVINRFARKRSPAALLAGHFCRDRWNERWLGDSMSFELHAHKRMMLGRFEINYRVRSRAGTAFGTGTPPLLGVEQDANTPEDAAAGARFDADAIAEFFRLAAAEHDRVAALLYPGLEAR